MEETQIEQEQTKHHRQRKINEDYDQFLMLRQILNLIFMIGAVVGVIIFLTGRTTVGTIVILSAMVFKIAECAFRFFK